MRGAITWRFLLGSVDRLVGGSSVSKTLGRWWCFGLEERITGLYAAICKANEKASPVKYSLLFRSLVLNVPLFRPGPLIHAHHHKESEPSSANG